MMAGHKWARELTDRTARRYLYVIQFSPGCFVVLFGGFVASLLALGGGLRNHPVIQALEPCFFRANLHACSDQDDGIPRRSCQCSVYCVYVREQPGGPAHPVAGCEVGLFPCVWVR